MMPRVLFVCGTDNQTTQMLQIAANLPECEHVFSPHYADRFLGAVQPFGLIDFTTPDRPCFRRAADFVRQRGVAIDDRAPRGSYRGKRRKHLGYRMNSSTKLACWDWIFGTAYLPNLEKSKEFGLLDAEFPENYFRQHLFAFRPFRDD